MNGKMLDNCCCEAIVHVENTNFTQTFSSDEGGKKLQNHRKTKTNYTGNMKVIFANFFPSKHLDKFLAQV